MRQCGKCRVGSIVLGLVCIAWLTLAAGRADAQETFIARWTNSSGDETSRAFDIWVPEDVTRPLQGAVFWWPGSGGSFQGMARSRTWQNFSRAADLALVGASAGYAPTVEPVAAFAAIMDEAGRVTDRPELADAPHLHIGHSLGALGGDELALRNGERALAFASVRGGNFQQSSWDDDAPRPAPGIYVPGSWDGNVITRAENVREGDFLPGRERGRPVAYALDLFRGHNDFGQSYEMGLYFRAESLKAQKRHGGLDLPLASIPKKSGWLGEIAIQNGLATFPAQSSPFPEIAPYNQYTGDVARASWLPTKGAAFAYRAFTAWSGVFLHAAREDGTGPRDAFANGPLVLEGLGMLELFEEGERIVFSVNPRDFGEDVGLETMTLYRDGVPVQTLLEAGDDGWVFDVPLGPRGVQGLVVIAEDGAGNRSSAFRAVSVVPEPSGLGLMLLLSGGWMVAMRRRRG